jgi:sodium/hydrogen antiporter
VVMPFGADAFVTTLALVGLVILIGALLSGAIERSGLPQVLAFLGLGAALGPAGLGVVNIDLDSPALRVVATLSLVLVLFTDAVSLDVQEVRQHGRLAGLVVGPGTLLSAALVGVAAWGILGLSPAAAAIVGAALASTDPVLLRGMLRGSHLPGASRLALRLESGLNDVVLLPIVLVAMAVLGHEAADGSAAWARLGVELGLLGPALGVGIGLVSVAALDLVRRQLGVRRDYESLYSLGVAFTAYAAAEAVHGSGFLAAFAAGLTIAALDVELCDCFLEYGQTTAEMALLFTFVLFGGSLIWSGLASMDGRLLLFAVVALLVRPAVFLLALGRAGLDRRALLLTAWFGPRGLSSLLLVLLPVFAGIPGSDQLFAICSVVVLVSIVVHGGTPLLLGRGDRRPQPNAARDLPTAAGEPPPAEAAELDRHAIPAPGTLSPADGALGGATSAGAGMADGTAAETSDEGQPFPTDPLRITTAELRRLEAQGAPAVPVDVRTERMYGRSDLQARGAVRLDPDRAVEQARALDLPRDAWLAAYCT